MNGGLWVVALTIIGWAPRALAESPSPRLTTCGREHEQPVQRYQREANGKESWFELCDNIVRCEQYPGMHAPECLSFLRIPGENIEVTLNRAATAPSVARDPQRSYGSFASAPRTALIGEIQRAADGSERATLRVPGTPTVALCSLSLGYTTAPQLAALGKDLPPLEDARLGSVELIDGNPRAHLRLKAAKRRFEVELTFLNQRSMACLTEVNPYYASATRQALDTFLRDATAHDPSPFGATQLRFAIVGEGIEPRPRPIFGFQVRIPQGPAQKSELEQRTLEVFFPRLANPRSLTGLSWNWLWERSEKSGRLLQAEGARTNGDAPPTTFTSPVWKTTSGGCTKVTSSLLILTSGCLTGQVASGAKRELALAKRPKAGPFRIELSEYLPDVNPNASVRTIYERKDGPWIFRTVGEERSQFDPAFWHDTPAEATPPP